MKLSNPLRRVQPTLPRPSTAPQEAVKVNNQLPTINIRCKWFMGYKVRASETPSGTEYVFAADEVRPVKLEDVEYLTSLQKAGGGCCGSDPKPFQYFEKE